MNRTLLILLNLSVFTVLSCQKNALTPEEHEPTGTTTISITEQGNITIPFNARTATIHYTITNPVEGGTIKPEASVEWISDIDTSVEGSVSLSVEENTTTESRSVILTLRYEYEGCEEEIEAQINLIQEACPYTYIKELPLSYGYYYGTITGGSPNYYLSLAESPMENNIIGDGFTYILDIYSDEPEDMNAIAPAVGTYTLSETFEAGTLHPLNSSVRIKTSDGTTSSNFTEGTLVISRDGDQYNYEAVLTDTNGEIHHISYTGPVALTDFSQGDFTSTLREDYVADLTGASCSALYYGDTYGGTSGIPTSNWYISLSNLPNGDHFQLDICAPPTSNTETGITPGTYLLLDCDYGELTALKGFTVNGTKYGSWFWVYENAAQVDPIAPLDSGSITISRDNDTYTITIRAFDDNPDSNSITATWTGQIEITDMTIY